MSLYTSAVHQLLLEPPLPDLGPGSPKLLFRERLTSLSLEEDFPRCQNRSLAQCCQAGLWLLFDFLDESHALSQDIDTPTGSYWHGIMHRREPDPSNSRYWFRKVGAHPVLEQLKAVCTEKAYPFESAFHFIDLCEKVRGTGSALEKQAQVIQMIEWQLLFDWCYGLSVAQP